MTNPWPATCNYCGAPLIGGMRCPRCSYQRPKQSEVRFSGFTGGGAASAPTAALRGSASFSDEGRNTRDITVPNVTISAGSSLLIAIGFAQGSEGTFFSGSVVWGSANGAQRSEAFEPVNLRAMCDVWQIDNPGAGTHDVVATIGATEVAPTSCVMLVYEIVGGPTDPMDSPPPLGGGTQNGNGISAVNSSSISWSTNPLYPTTVAPTLAMVFIATNGPSTDTAGTWTAPLVALDRVGTNAGSSDEVNITVSSASRVVATIGSQSAAKSGFTARDLAGAQVYMRGA